ncbi:outer membrane protein assembly factor BamB family protein, partial [Streptomyces shenzhenensis]|uniref:outer membrane protein assembly factor BamB family protein n=1 Tax=Streptomyces shenzhenensis TaxID=943815 RepID=UPI0015F06C37
VLGLAARHHETSRAAAKASKLVDPGRSLDTKTVAKPLWTAPLTEALVQITGGGDTVVGVGAGGLRGYDRRTGHRTWGPLANAADSQMAGMGGNPVAYADGTLYVLAKAGLGGSTARTMRAVDLATGRVRWTSTGPSGAFYVTTLVPGVLGDQVYVTGTLNAMSGAWARSAAGSAFAWAVDRASGKILWTRTDAGDDPNIGAGTARLMVPSSGTRVLWATSNPDRSSPKLSVLDTTASGKVLWEEPAPGGAQSVTTSALADLTVTWYDGPHCYAGGHFLYLGDRLYALDPATGQTVWRTQDSAVFFLALVADPDGKTVYAATRSYRTGTITVYAFDSATGAVRWAGSVTVPRADTGVGLTAMQCADGTVYLWAAGSTWALDTADGKARWTYRFTGNSAQSATAPVALWAGGGHLYGTTDNKLVAIGAGNSTAS